MGEAAGKPKHILLVVDDEQDTCLAMKSILEKAGYIAECAFDGAQAIAKAREKVYDLIFLDIYLPEMTGLEIFRELKRLNSQLKICLMTGWPKGVAEHREECLAMLNEGALDKMLRKPFSKEEVLRAAKDILGD
ncbi:MAG: response regulator [Candidatus Omnitrophica bacterium]|nr:response regulator [Candidatus Omnitrophota bacterium]